MKFVSDLEPSLEDTLGDFNFAELSDMAAELAIQYPEYGFNPVVYNGDVFLSDEYIDPCAIVTKDGIVPKRKPTFEETLTGKSQQEEGYTIIPFPRVNEDGTVPQPDNTFENERTGISPQREGNGSSTDATHQGFKPNDGEPGINGPNTIDPQSAVERMVFSIAYDALKEEYGYDPDLPDGVNTHDLLLLAAYFPLVKTNGYISASNVADVLGIEETAINKVFEEFRSRSFISPTDDGNYVMHADIRSYLRDNINDISQTCFQYMNQRNNSSNSSFGQGFLLRQVCGDLFG